MPEYDAFGREIGENTLEGLGGDSRAESQASASPEWEAQAAAAPPRAQVTVRRTAPRALGCLFSLVFLAAVVGVVGIAASGIIDAAQDAIDDVTDTIDGPALPDAEPPAEPPTGIAGESLIAPANLTRVIGQLEQEGKRATQVIVRPDRVVADLAKGGRGRLMQIPADGDVLRSDPHPLPGGTRTVALADLDPEVPARLVRRSAARFAVRPQGIDYLIARPDFTDPRTHRWVAYFKNGIYVEGDASGKVQRRIDS